MHSVKRSGLFEEVVVKQQVFWIGLPMVLALTACKGSGSEPGVQPLVAQNNYYTGQQEQGSNNITDNCDETFVNEYNSFYSSSVDFNQGKLSMEEISLIDRQCKALVRRQDYNKQCLGEGEVNGQRVWISMADTKNFCDLIAKNQKSSENKETLSESGTSAVEDLPVVVDTEKEKTAPAGELQELPPAGVAKKEETNKPSEKKLEEVPASSAPVAKKEPSGEPASDSSAESAPSSEKKNPVAISGVPPEDSKKVSESTADHWSVVIKDAKQTLRSIDNESLFFVGGKVGTLAELSGAFQETGVLCLFTTGEDKKTVESSVKNDCVFRGKSLKEQLDVNDNNNLAVDLNMDSVSLKLLCIKNNKTPFTFGDLRAALGKGKTAVAEVLLF